MLTRRQLLASSIATAVSPALGRSIPFEDGGFIPIDMATASSFYAKAGESWSVMGSHTPGLAMKLLRTTVKAMEPDSADDATSRQMIDCALYGVGINKITGSAIRNVPIQSFFPSIGKLIRMENDNENND